MKKLTSPELECVISLTGTQDFDKFLQILKESVMLLGTQCALLKDETELRWSQGRMQELLDILKKVGDSRFDLDYLRSKRPKD